MTSHITPDMARRLVEAGIWLKTEYCYERPGGNTLYKTANCQLPRLMSPPELGLTICPAPTLHEVWNALPNNVPLVVDRQRELCCKQLLPGAAEYVDDDGRGRLIYYSTDPLVSLPELLLLLVKGGHITAEDINRKQQLTA